MPLEHKCSNSTEHHQPQLNRNLNAFKIKLSVLKTIKKMDYIKKKYAQKSFHKLSSILKIRIP